MKSIKFDDIHSENKQKFLNKMMVLAAAETHKIESDVAKLSYCPVCHTENITFYDTKFGYNLDRCKQCHHIFCNPMPSQAQLNVYYNSEMKVFENDFFQATFEQRIPIFNHRIQVIKNYCQQGNLLDVGSAIGIFVEALMRESTNLRIECCEPSLDAVSRLKKRYPSIIIHNNWLQELKQANHYDAITLWDTLEHVVDLAEFVGNIHRLLKVGGHWFFSTPNTRSFEWNIAGREHTQLLPPGHVNLFNTHNIRHFLENNGFNVVEIQTPNGSLDVSYVNKIIAQNKYDQLALGNFLTNQLEKKQFQEDFARLISQNGLAGNMLVVAQKK